MLNKLNKTDGTIQELSALTMVNNVQFNFRRCNVGPRVARASLILKADYKWIVFSYNCIL